MFYGDSDVLEYDERFLLSQSRPVVDNYENYIKFTPSSKDNAYISVWTQKHHSLLISCMSYKEQNAAGRPMLADTVYMCNEFNAIAGTHVPSIGL